MLLADSTSVNLYKLAVAACDARPGRGVIITDDDNFPTDRYVLEGVAAARGMTLRVLPSDLDTGCRPWPRCGRRSTTTSRWSRCRTWPTARARSPTWPRSPAATHAAGALVLWDLCHSAGAVPAPLRSAGVDLAVGCTYKHLNAGPGAPAFLYVRRELQAELRQPIWGWFGQRDQFAMGPAYDPAPSVDRFLVGTPPVLGGYAALCGIQLSAAAGIDRIFAKGTALGEYAIELHDEWLAPHGFALASPRSAPGSARDAAPPRRVADQPGVAGRLGDSRLPQPGPAPAGLRAALHPVRRRVRGLRPAPHDHGVGVLAPVFRESFSGYLTDFGSLHR